ncbi:PLDc_N domain-containing protein [Ktedonobacteria bacterium brp13]|nr:PLDc_N domain-containing protein [Ktedonobacteria bacterium brp13]
MGQSRGCLTNTILFLIIVFIPVVGHIIETVFLLEDDHSPLGKVLWLVLIWAVPFVGPLLYLLFGQRPVRHAPISFGQSSYVPPQQQYYQH